MISMFIYLARPRFAHVVPGVESSAPVMLVELLPIITVVAAAAGFLVGEALCRYIRSTFGGECWLLELARILKSTWVAAHHAVQRVRQFFHVSLNDDMVGIERSHADG